MSTEWENHQQRWWEQHYAVHAAANNYRGSPSKPQGIRHYYAEKLFRQVRSDVAGKLWIDVGAGTSSIIADLVHPLRYKYRYVATDISRIALQHGQRRIGQTPIISAASHLPFAQSQADVVSTFGLLQYLPMWQHTLRTLMDLLKPGGYIMLIATITKPRVLERWRKGSYTARFASQERSIEPKELKAILAERCEILLCGYSGSPLRFALSWFGGLDRWALRSYRITQLSVAVDRLWLGTLGKLVPSLGPGEITVLARKR
jgi:2-polyprenyl-3-methyl-5-hydroxy-6-metoxy-1,4-benzoquinol methylase